MKKQLRLIVICISFCLLALSLSGASNVYAKSKELDYSSKRIVKITRVKKAYKILAMFKGLGQIKCNYSKSFMKHSSGYGIEYYLVKEKRINTEKKLKKYLGKYFSKKIRKKLWKKRKAYFASHNNRLYYSPGNAEIDKSIYVKYRIIKRTSNKRVIRASIYSRSFPARVIIRKFRQKRINGRWKFTKISYPYFGLNFDD